MRQAHLLCALGEHAAVHLVVAGRVDDAAVRSCAASLCELDVKDDDWSGRAQVLRRTRDLWLATLGRGPREVAAFAAVRRAVRRVGRTPRPDVVIVEFAGLADLFRHRRPDSPPCVLTLHNVASQMANQQAAVAGGRRQRWLYDQDRRRAERWERRTMHRYDEVIVVSEADRRALGSLPATRVIPNGVDLTRVVPTPLPDQPVLCFVGALHTGPNIDGITWFCRDVLPHVRAQMPEVRLDIVGSRPTPEVLGLGDLPGVTVHADVPSISAHIHRSRVAVVPLRIGSGTRLKALEAMAAGRPVVGTSLGLDGLDLVDGEDVVVADGAPAMVDAVLAVLSDDALARRLAQRGPAVARRFDWVAIGGSFTEAILAHAARARTDR